MTQTLNPNRLHMTTLATCLVMCMHSTGWAADTTEPFELGFSDVDFYGGVHGLGLKAHETTLYLDAMLGVGLTPGFSLYLGTILYPNEYFGAASGDLYTGASLTPVDTDHLDVDLLLEATLRRLATASIAPGVELNLDLEPELTLGGLYLRVFIPFAQAELRTESEGAVSQDLVGATEVTVGAYLTVQTGHMIHVEYDMTIPFAPEDDAPAYVIGGIATSYNVVIDEHLELINQVVLDLPQGDETFSVGLMSGFIATLP